MKRYIISPTSLTLIGITAIASLKNLPALAEYGSSVVFYLLAGVLFLFLPTTLVSIELATLFPKEGGVYTWVQNAFGNKIGFFAIWLQWLGNVFWFPTLLSFAAESIAYLLYPPFAENQLFMVTTVLISFWGLTLLATMGLKTITRISTIGVLLGTILPGIFIILLGVLWVSTGNPVETSFERSDLIPSLKNVHNWVYLSGVLLAFLGIEMPAVHIQDMEDPIKQYPKAIIRAFFVILFLFLFGSLSISSVVPRESLNIETGIIQGFQFFFQKYDTPNMTNLFALLIGIGAFSTINAWIIGPTKALVVAAEAGDLPRFFHRKNERGMPTNLLFLQAIVVTIFSLFLLMLPSMEKTFWILSVLTGQLYVVMYCIIFAAVLKLRKLHPIDQRKHKPTFSTPLLTILCLGGFIGSSLSFCAGFFPPRLIEGTNILTYEIFLIVAIIASIATPFIILHFRKPEWSQHTKDQEE